MDTIEASGPCERAAKENTDLLTSKLRCDWLIVLPNGMPHSTAGIYTRYK